MPSCSAYNCSFRSSIENNSGKSCFKFPFRRPHILKGWIQNIRRENWKPSKTSILCSDHFEEMCFRRRGQRTRLRPDAVPTLFDFTIFSNKHKKMMKQMKDIEKTIEQELNLVPIQPSVPINIADIDHIYAKNHTVMNRLLEEKTAECELLKKKLKVANRHIARLKKTVGSSKQFIHDLRKIEKTISDQSICLLTKNNTCSKSLYDEKIISKEGNL